METKQVILLWVIGFIAMFTHYFISFTNNKNTGKFSIKIWVKQNWKTLTASSLSVILLFMMFMKKQTLIALDDYIAETSASWMIFFYKEIMAFAIGYLNIWIVELLEKKVREKANAKADEI